MRALILAALVCPIAGAAGEDPHLATIPRTAAEAARVAAVTGPPASFDSAEPFETRPGGAATSAQRVNANAFSHPSAGMDFARELDFKVGNGFFRKLWVTAPASTQVSDGLGPLYNARACQSCHLDARGHPPAGPEDTSVALFLRLSVTDPAHPGETLPEPTYGGQLQTFGIPGHPPEGRLEITHDPMPVELAGGEIVTLQRPRYTIADPAYGPLDPAAMLSPRAAQQMIGLGLLEAVPAEDILAGADPEDADGDGISGRANMVWSDEFRGEMLGRFGHKAGQPTIRAQAAAAFAGDLGISTPLHPEGWGDCTAAEADCRAAPDGGAPEADTEVLDLVTFYSRNLAVPARRDVDDPEVLAGKRVFHDAGCTACHRPKFVTHRLEDRPEQSFQLIWPYTDMLLHDMGEGLADHRPEQQASGTEWRTAPLWGIGLTGTVTGRESFLHDGRARSLLEAILWHGGEAKSSRDRVVAMPEAEREALVRFLGSL
jgi:CxxC motif-containing protein (DUF1111 family)